MYRVRTVLRISQHIIYPAMYAERKPVQKISSTHRPLILTTIVQLPTMSTQPTQAPLSRDHLLLVPGVAFTHGFHCMFSLYVCFHCMFPLYVSTVCAIYVRRFVDVLEYALSCFSTSVTVDWTD